MSISKQKSYISARNRNVNVQDPEWRDERAARVEARRLVSLGIARRTRAPALEPGPIARVPSPRRLERASVPRASRFARREFRPIVRAPHRARRARARLARRAVRVDPTRARSATRYASDNVRLGGLLRVRARRLRRRDGLHGGGGDGEHFREAFDDGARGCAAPRARSSRRRGAHHRIRSLAVARSLWHCLRTARERWRFGHSEPEVDPR